MDDRQLSGALRAATTEPSPKFLAETVQLISAELARQGALRQEDMTMPDSDLMTIVKTIDLRVPDPSRAARFYASVLGWRFREPDHGAYTTSNTRVPVHFHALSDRPAVSIGIVVGDPASRAEEVRRLGGEVVEKSDDAVVCRDDLGRGFTLIRESLPFGNSTAADKDVAQFDLAFVFGDESRTFTFYRELLGWEFRRPFERATFHDIVHNGEVLAGIGFSPNDDAFVLPVFGVNDGPATAQRITELGGDAGDEMGYGPNALGRNCHDDQGTSFVIRYAGELER